MKTSHFHTYCFQCGLLDSDDPLRAVVKVISGGICLSGLDQITALDHAMHLFEEASLVMRRGVRDEAKPRYPKAINIISKTISWECTPDTLPRTSGSRILTSLEMKTFARFLPLQFRRRGFHNMDEYHPNSDSYSTKRDIRRCKMQRKVV